MQILAPWMEAKLIFEAEIVAERNLLRTHYRGHVTEAGLKEGIVRFEGLLKKLKPGFTIFADMSELDLMDLECGAQLARIMELCKANKVGSVIRVIPDPDKDIGVNILSIVHYRGKVPIATYDTLAEAMKDSKLR